MKLKPGGSYIVSPDWIQNKKVTINLTNDDEKCFQYAAKVALNHEEIRKRWHYIAVKRVSSLLR